MNKVFPNPIMLAIDTSSLDDAKSLIVKLKDCVGGIKLGMEFFNSFGPSGIKILKEFDIPIFLDLKLHDIPATVYKTITTLLTLEPAIINVHASGGKEMMMAAAKALKDSGNKTTKIIAVTILTSLDDDDLCKLGFSEPSKDLVLKLAN
jgi:orotidine-5'-phosphate decarboxylase